MLGVDDDRVENQRSLPQKGPNINGKRFKADSTSLSHHGVPVQKNSLALGLFKSCALRNLEPHDVVSQTRKELDPKLLDNLILGELGFFTSRTNLSGCYKRKQKRTADSLEAKLDLTLL